MADDVVIGEEELLRKFRSMSEAVQGATLGAVARAGSLPILNGAKDNIKDQGLMESRQLSRSLHTEVVEQSKDRAVSEIGTNLVYAAIHEFGGVIKPKTRKYLAVPVGTYKGSPLRHNDLKLRKTNGGSLVLVDGGNAVQYVLKTSVEIPARPYLRPAYDEKKPLAINEMRDVYLNLVMKAASE
jgi:phage gpG-like protein